MRLLVEDHQARRRGLGTVALATVATLTGPLGVQSASADDGNPTFQIGAGDYTQLRNAVRAMVDEGRDRRVPHTNLSSNGWRVVTGFCRPLRQPLPYGPVVDALGKVSPWLSDLPPTSGALAPLLPRPCCDRYHPGRTPTAPCSARPVTRCTTSAKRPSKLGHDRRARTYLPETQDLAGRADTGRSNVSPASGCCGSTGRPAGRWTDLETQYDALARAYPDVRLVDIDRAMCRGSSRSPTAGSPALSTASPPRPSTEAARARRT